MGKKQTDTDGHQTDMIMSVFNPLGISRTDTDIYIYMSVCPSALSGPVSL